MPSYYKVVIELECSIAYIRLFLSSLPIAGSMYLFPDGMQPTIMNVVM